MVRQWMSKGAALLFLTAVLAGVSGCAWMGKTAGKAQAKMENSIEAMDRSYRESYEQERARGSSEKRDAETGTEPGL